MRPGDLPHNPFRACVSCSNGNRAEWYGKITEQHPDERVAWTAEAGKGMSGVVTFTRSTGIGGE